VKRRNDTPPAQQVRSDLERAVARLQETEELLELAQEAGRVGIFEWQVPSGVVRLSPRFLALYGLTDFDGRYQTWLKSIFREDVLHVTNLFDAAFAAKDREINFEFRINVAGSGELKWIEARNLAFYGPDDRAGRVVGVNVDITERKRTLAQLRAFTETLEEAVKGPHARTRDRERSAPQSRGIAAPGAKDGGGRPAHRRRRARLQ
jgi:PAS domain S-box-containing protein